MKPQNEWTDEDWRIEAVRLAKAFAADMGKQEGETTIKDFGSIIDFESSPDAGFSNQLMDRERIWLDEAEKSAEAYCINRNGKKKLSTFAANDDEEGDEVRSDVREWMDRMRRRGWWFKN